MSFNSITELKKNGFEGFISFEKLTYDLSYIPAIKGVYLVLHTEKSKPKFLKVGTGGHFKNKNPNVSLDTLQQNWVDNALVVYIGKAGSLTNNATLRSRIKDYVSFGNNKNVGHWGGRYIWQIKESKKLKVCWLRAPLTDPRKLERSLIEDFKSVHNKRPFANLVG